VIGFLDSGKVAPKNSDFLNDYNNSLIAFKTGKAVMIFNME